ncbi:unnamed protein product [Leptidea sinapis]|uniref:Uncharacterized protein n=1 Tax=Leptidea sinapis TaxID=189913 RepID=A0A5E4R0F1_9NEOP|nr:unnamed protein product [Leptidea sinapis]
MAEQAEKVSSLGSYIYLNYPEEYAAYEKGQLDTTGGSKLVLQPERRYDVKSTNLHGFDKSLIKLLKQETKQPRWSVIMIISKLISQDINIEHRRTMD